MHGDGASWSPVTSAPGGGLKLLRGTSDGRHLIALGEGGTIHELYLPEPSRSGSRIMPRFSEFEEPANAEPSCTWSSLRASTRADGIEPVVEQSLRGREGCSPPGN